MASESGTGSGLLATPSFQLREAWENGSLRLSIVGELDMASAPVLEERMRRLASMVRLIRVDVSELEFIDSSGVRALIETVDRAHRDRWQLEIVGNLTPQVHRVLELMGVESYICGDGATAG